MIKLNTNENPYPPSPGVKKVLSEMDVDKLRLYPDPKISLLVNGLAKYHNVDKEQVFVGVGSDDVLAMAFMTFLTLISQFCILISPILSIRYGVNYLM